MFSVESNDNDLPYNKRGPRGRTSAETKASSSQSKNGQNKYDGLSPQDALEQYGSELTEFEKIELGIYERIYFIGRIRR